MEPLAPPRRAPASPHDSCASPNSKQAKGRRSSREDLHDITDPSNVGDSIGGLGAFARLPAQRESTWNVAPRDDAPLVVGIAGGTGSGKTTVAAAIAERIGSEHLIHLQHDAYYKSLPREMPLEERAKTNFDHPDALETSLLCEHLRALRAGRAVNVPRYDFATHQRLESEELKQPARIILVEGILIYAHEQLREMLDIKIFVDTESDVRFIRRLQRDVAERGRDVESVIHQYLSTVRPMHNQFVEPAKRFADIIIPTGCARARRSPPPGRRRRFRPGACVTCPARMRAPTRSFNSVALEMVIARLEQLLEWGNEVPALEKRGTTPRLLERVSREAHPPPASDSKDAAGPARPSSPLGSPVRGEAEEVASLMSKLSAAASPKSKSPAV